MHSWSSGSGQRARLLSNDPSLNPAEVYSFYSVNCMKRTKINNKRPGWSIFKEKNEFKHKPPLCCLETKIEMPRVPRGTTLSFLQGKDRYR